DLFAKILKKSIGTPILGASTKVFYSLQADYKFKDFFVTKSGGSASSRTWVCKVPFGASTLANLSPLLPSIIDLAITSKTTTPSRG
ncbi:MAG: hypothetical protein II899_08510, partial [Bacteroidales bacterium]|nr:hypothetical protein [Bacteroidales bacterium]